MNYLKKNGIWILIILVLIFFLIGERSSKAKTINRYQSNLEILKDSIYSYKLRNDLLVTARQALHVDYNELVDQVFIKDDSLKLMIKKFKSVKSTVKIITNTEIKEIKIPFDKPVDSFAAISFSSIDKFYTITGEVTNKAITIDKITIPNTQRIVIGKAKKSFFKRQYEVSVSNSNKLIQVNDIESQIVTEKIKRFGIGPYIGYGFNGLNAGISVHYSVFRF